MGRRDDVDQHAARIVAALGDGESYADLARRYNTSRGKIYAIAVRHGARKNEARILERTAQRKARRMEFLQEVMDASQRCDVLDFLDGVPEGSVHLTATSIPYNVGKAYGGAEGVDRQRHHFYLGWVLQALSEMERTLADGGVLFLQVGSTRDDTGALYPLDALLFEHLRGMGLSFQNRVIWEQPHGLTPRGRLAERHETALVFSKGPPRHFNVTSARVPQKQPTKRAYKGPNKGQLSGHPLGAWPGNVWRIPSVRHNHPEASAGRHPAQFPLTLVKRAVLLYTVPGDVVCDPFVGSGTTQIACRQTGRSFIGCDLFYEDLRARRLAEVAPDLVCDLPGVTQGTLAVWQAEARAVSRAPEPVSAAQLEREWVRSQRELFGEHDAGAEASPALGG